MDKTISTLDFKLILDDKEFNQKVKQLKQDAKTLNIELSKLLDIRKASGSMSAKEYQTLKRLDNLESNRRINAEKELAAHARRLAAEERITAAKERQLGVSSMNNRLMREALSLATSYLSIWGAGKLLRSLVETTAEFELQRTTLAAMLQDVEKANQIFDQMKELAVVSPFAFKELATYAKQLSAYSVPVGELYDTTKMLADVSAGLGVGMDRLVLAYGQVRSAAFLRGQEVRQFTEAGIPILEELRKQFVALGEEGITVGDVFDKISQRLVPFEMVEKVFKDMTSEGGKFFNMQEIQAETLKGKISNLKDAYQIMFSEIGDRKSGLLKGSVDAVRSLAENYERVGRTIASLVITLGAYKAIMVSIKVLEGSIVGMLNGMKAGSALMAALNKESRIFAALMKTIKSINPWTALAAAVIGIGSRFIIANAQAQRFKKELKEIASVKMDEAEKAAGNFSKLVEQLKNSTEGSQAYRDAIVQLNKQYGEYLPNLLTEKNALSEILKVENQVTNAIYARSKAYATEEATRKVEDRYGKDVRDTGDTLRDVLANMQSKYGVIGQEAAKEFIVGFRERLKTSNGDPFDVFNEYAEQFFGKTFLKTSFGNIIDKYADAVRGLEKEITKAMRSIETEFGTGGYSSVEEMRVVNEINDAYDRAIAELRKKQMPADEFNNELAKLNLEKLFALKKAYEELDEQAATTGQKGAWANKIKEVNAQIEALQPAKLKGWRKTISDLLKDLSGEGYNTNGLAPKDSDKLFEYVEELSKERKNLNAEMAVAKSNDNALYEADKKRLDVIRQINEALNGAIDTYDNTKHPNKSSGKSQAQIDLETGIDLLKKLKDAYDKLDGVVGKDMIPGLLKGFFSEAGVTDDMVKNLDFQKQLVEAADVLEKYDKDAAARLRNTFGKDPVSELAESAKAAEKFRKELEKLIAKEYDLEGEGLAFDISKLLMKLTTDNNLSFVDIDKMRSEIDAQEAYIKAQMIGTEQEKEKAWQNYKKAAYNTLDEIFAKEVANNRKATQEKVNDLAGKYVKEQLDLTKGIDLSHWGNKSLEQINDLISKLETLRDAPLEISDDILAEAERLGIDLGKLAEIIKGLFQANIDNALEEKLKKVQKIASTISNTVGQIGGKIASLGDSIDDDWLKSMGDVLETAGKIADAVAECEPLMKAISGTAEGASGSLKDVVKSADFATMIIKVALIGIEKITDAIAASAERTKALKEAQIEYLDALHQARLDEANGIFGTDTIDILAEKYRNLTDWIGRTGKAMWTLRGGTTEFYKNLAELRGIGRGKWQDASVEFSQMFGFPELDSDVNKWKAYAKEIIAAKDHLKKGLENNSVKSAFDDFVAGLEKTIAAMEELEAEMKGIFDGLSDSITDKLLENFDAIGDAVYDLEGIFYDLGESILKSLLNSLVINEILDKYKAQFSSFMLDYATSEKDAKAAADLAKQLGELAGNIREELEGYGEAINATIDAFKANGLYEGADSGESLGNGIKSITEDTANLLASYINAMRADVARGNEQRQMILDRLLSMSGYEVSPTLEGYLNRIEANTYDNAQNTREIMNDIKSMLTVSGGGTALRVYM